jgi:hypothetical protein
MMKKFAKVLHKPYSEPIWEAQTGDFRFFFKPLTIFKRFGGRMSLFLFIFHILYIHTFIYSITFIQYIYPSPFAGASLHLLSLVSSVGKTPLW